MHRLATIIDVQAAPELVWAVLCDVERWPEWTSTVKSIQRLDTGPFAVGCRARIVQPGLRPAKWVVTELDEAAKFFTWAMRSPGLEVAGRHQVEADGAGSRVTLSLEFTGFLAPFVVRLYRRMNERYLAIEAKGLKDRSER